MSDPRARPPTILVIDDDAEIRYSLSRVLSSRGYQVAEAAGGEPGIELLRGGPAPDLIFLDVRM
ncbi:MAG: response regulator, partial [Opitutaceae bacterium]